MKESDQKFPITIQLNSRNLPPSLCEHYCVSVFNGAVGTRHLELVNFKPLTFCDIKFRVLLQLLWVCVKLPIYTVDLKYQVT